MDGMNKCKPDDDDEEEELMIISSISPSTGQPRSTHLQCSRN
jgi:hypothetical protein